MNKYNFKTFSFLTLFATTTLVTTLASAQQVVSTKGDKIGIEDVKVEPWRVVGTANKAQSNTQSIYQNGNVGIGDFSSEAVSEKLQVKGDTEAKKGFLSATINADNTAAASYVPLGVNTTTGELIKMTNDRNVKPISYVTFTINTHTGEDWIKQFDTKIPSSEYTVVLINAVFKSLLKVTDSKIAPFSYSAAVKDGTWVLQADYVGDVPQSGSKHQWTLICMVLQNSMVKDLGTMSVTLNGDDSGALADKPAGL